MKEKQQADNQKRMLMAAIVLGVLSIILIIIILLKDCGSCNQVSSAIERDPNASLGLIDTMSEEEIQAKLDAIVEEGMFNVAINTTPEFTSGDAYGNLNIENIPANRYSMTVKITLNETGETIYHTGLIDPNHYIEYDKLDVKLEKGAYPATAVFTAYDSETLEVQGDVSVSITVYVDN